MPGHQRVNVGGAQVLQRLFYGLLHLGSQRSLQSSASSQIKAQRIYSRICPNALESMNSMPLCNTSNMEEKATQKSFSRSARTPTCLAVVRHSARILPAQRREPGTALFRGFF